MKGCAGRARWYFQSVRAVRVGGPAVRHVAAESRHRVVTGLFLAAGRGGLRRSLARAGCGADIPLAARSGAFAPTQEERKPEARAKINTDLTRTRRHSPAYGGIRSTMAASENLAFSPAEMRVSWADYSFPGWWARDDRPSEKRTFGLTGCVVYGLHDAARRVPGVRHVICPRGCRPGRCQGPAQRGGGWAG
jgi:hypothetical protein